jgi:hypothetical protein
VFGVLEFPVINSFPVFIDALAMPPQIDCKTGKTMFRKTQRKGVPAFFCRRHHMEQEKNQ